MTITNKLETESVLYSVVFEDDGIFIEMKSWYLCPCCDGGHVTHNGGGLYMCNQCGWQN